MAEGRANAQPVPGVRTRTLSEAISNELMQRILDGKFKPGDALPSEDDLAAQFDVSRPVIREAVKQLALLGMIESRQGRSTRVSSQRQWNQFDPGLLLARSRAGAVDDILLELLELRRLIETGAAGLAALRATPEAVAQMDEAYRRMEVSQRDVERFVEGDIAFHDALLAATGNYLLTQLIETLGPMLRVGRRMSLERRPDGAAASQLGHRAILDAVRAQDAETARRAMREHLSWTAELRLGDGGESNDPAAPRT